jgi:glycosyltransferase involved in cell wall biosynthesis
MFGRQEVTPRRPRVLFVGAFPPPTARVAGGNVSDCRALLESSFTRRFELTLLDSTQMTVAPSLLERSLMSARRITRFVRLFETNRPDAMLIFASFGLSFFEKVSFALYARLRGVPALLSIRSGHFLDACRRSALFRNSARLLIRVPARLVCQSEQWRRFFVEEMDVPADKCAIVENWVASNGVLSMAARRAHGAARPVRILFMGAIERFKGVFDLLEAIRLLGSNDELPSFQVSIAGEGSERAAVEAIVHQHDLGSMVRFEGLLEGPEKSAALESAHIFVLPSHTEGLPNAMVEAMASGLPPVVTPVGSVPDVIADLRNGILVPPRDPPALAAALRKLLLSRDLRQTLGQAAHETARSRFATERAVGQLSALITDVIAFR